ncbi:MULTISPECIES: hypothetical protein [unclassified Pseudomonas]|uniref:hypothetical protein n=1 Tax=unclassified Pseudomonas TaxID=196821 RepID=UPI0021C9927F|nr:MULTISPECIES: hypothetical protein [unclassified Pseudomonas]MCU1733603.1 hypothetical protein [Pseudomonas sp. 20P_3.2_Bac4]MCU1743267.1 hypothetical protein [Pseudomonas sp. 20P_3.2_Bac5]
MTEMEKPLGDDYDKDDSIDFEQVAEEQAKRIEGELFENTENANKTTAVIASFVASCNARGEKPLELWLSDEFRKYPDLWKDEQDLLQTSREVIQSTTAFNRSRESLQAHLDTGRSKASWLAGEIEKNAAVTGSVNVGQYAGGIDRALADASENARKIITTQAGPINQNPNLNGLIAEQHHVDTFNIDAAAKGSPYRARVVGSQELNSVDIEIVDGNGNVVGKYQSKYGADAKATNTQLNGGDYSDQKRLVPEGQSADVPDSTEVIEVDGVKSKPLSKEEAKALQEKAQAEEESRQYDWNDTNRIDIAKQIGKQAVVGACIAVGMQGTRILARRAWNWLNGRENPSANDELKEFFDSSLRAGTNTAAQVAVSGAVVVAVKNGWLGAALRGTPAGLITNIACVGLQNAKILYKLGKGELTGEEAVDAIGNTTVTTTMAIAGATKGASLGAAIGTVFGPVGIAVGGFVGGVAGGIAGGQIGEVVYSAGKAVAKTALKTVARVVEGAGRALESIGRGMSNFASSLFSGW